MAPVLVVAATRGDLAQLREIARGWVLTRGIVDAIATLLFLVALFHLPIGTATAINMTTPLLVMVLAAVAIGERVGRARWLAAGIGFAGVLLIIQPRADDFNAYALICLLSTVLLSIRDLLTRRVHARIPSMLVTLSNTIFVSLLAGGLMLIEGWRALGALEFGLLAVAAIFIACAYFLIVSSTRRGDVSLIAPFRYTALLFALIAGYVVWGERPNALAWGGIVLLVGSGVYVLRVSRRARAAPVAPE